MSLTAESPTIAGDLPQERRIVTELPGPRSRELFAARNAAVSAGVGIDLPGLHRPRPAAASCSTSTATR